MIFGPPSQYAAVVLDCDGVILDSNSLKIEAFRETLISFDFDSGTMEAFSNFQSKNFGTSRHRLFDLLLEGIFGKVPPSVEKSDLLSRYGDIVKSGYLVAPETSDLRETLTCLSKSLPLFVVSGSDESELRYVFKSRDLTHFFVEIFGSPATKADNLRLVLRSLERKNLEGRPLLFVGDADADMNAAIEVGAFFVFAARYSTVRDQMSIRSKTMKFPQIEQLSDLLLFAGWRETI